MILRGSYPAFEGPIANGPHLRIGLCMSPGVRLMQNVEGARLEGCWRRGAVIVTPPDGQGVSKSAPVDMIGLAVLPSMVHANEGMDWNGLSDRFHTNPLITSVITALFYEAEAHGPSTAFFEHGIALIVRRLSETEPPALNSRVPRPLSLARLARVRSYVETRLGDDISVVEMAAVAGMDPSGFTRALRARTGVPPYGWLTQLRMERAASLLASGWKVLRVANALGYSNGSKFAAAFRRVTGSSPSQWHSE